MTIITREVTFWALRRSSGCLYIEDICLLTFPNIVNSDKLNKTPHHALVCENRCHNMRMKHEEVSANNHDIISPLWLPLYASEYVYTRIGNFKQTEAIHT